MIESNRAIIVNINTGKRVQSMSNNFDFEKYLLELSKLARRDIKTDGYYKKIHVGYENENSNLYAKAVAFTVAQDETTSDRHLLEVSMLHPSMQVEVSKPLVYGSKVEIIKYLNNKDNFKTIEEKLNKMSEELQEM